ncbi:hypothetical protein [Streptomyces caatingaensis]|uniref:Uncharacterized protein n=1 Tax=Streptomyces caatingaensis TaxID=1678637 RepID=A0A0K9XK35_9ACTN|nr:hypothetical protein [Streptomyces caatingaensis]KNB53456.1 hypothetical protein AC230_01930 [Streptomyces caatingaensis]
MGEIFGEPDDVVPDRIQRGSGVAQPPDGIAGGGAGVLVEPDTGPLQQVIEAGQMAVRIFERFLEYACRFCCGACAGDTVGWCQVH